MRFALLFLLLTSIQVQAIDSLNGQKKARPENLNLEKSVLSDTKKLKVSYKPQKTPLPLNKIHSWEISVIKEGNIPISDAKVKIYAGMPEHLHGMTTKAKVIYSGSGGDYLANGMKFHMPGWWEIILEISIKETTDFAYFNILVGEDLISNHDGHHHEH